MKNEQLAPRANEVPSSTTAEDEAVPQRERARSSSLYRRIASASLVLAAILVGVFQSSIRQLEAWTAGELVRATFATDMLHVTSDGDPAVGFTVGGDWLIARVPLFTGSALAIAIVLAAAGVTVWNARVSLGRVLLIAGVGTVALLLVNQIRLVSMMNVWIQGNEIGDQLIHGPMGAAMMPLIALGILALMFFSALKPALRRARPAAEV